PGRPEEVEVQAGSARRQCGRDSGQHPHQVHAGRLIPPMKFANLTIGRKIVFGFTVVFLLLGAVTTTGYLALGAAGKKFSSYASSAQETNAAGELEAAMLTLKMQV